MDTEKFRRSKCICVFASFVDTKCAYVTNSRVKRKGLNLGENERKLTLNTWQVLEEVKTCCEALSEKLGKQTFFFGDK